MKWIKDKWNSHRITFSTGLQIGKDHFNIPRVQLSQTLLESRSLEDEASNLYSNSSQVFNTLESAEFETVLYEGMTEKLTSTVVGIKRIISRTSLGREFT